jgi:arabinofuranan 3-O-arabinosyltransferase
VPAGQGGVITLSFAPATAYHLGIILSALALLAVLAVAIGTGWLGPLTGRRRAPEPPLLAGSDLSGGSSRPGRPLGQLLTLVLLTAVMVVVGGPAAVAVPVLAILGRWRPAWLPRIAAAAMLAAGVIAEMAAQPTVLGSGAFSGSAQACALIALSAVLMPALGSRTAGLEA